MFQPLTLMLGLRYAGARGRRSFASFVSGFSTIGILLGVAALMLVSSVMNGFEQQLKDNLLGVIPHALVTNDARRLNMPAEQAEQLADVSGVVASSPFISAEAMVQGPAALTGAELYGVDPANPADRLLNMLDEQTLGYFRDLPYGLVMGAGLARELGVSPGDKIRLTVTEGSRFTPLGRVPSQRLFTLVGTFATGQDVDRQVVLARLEDAGRLLRYRSEQVSGLRLWLADPFQVDQLPALDNGLRYETWQHSRGELFQAVAMEKRLMSLMLALIILVAAFNILSAMVMVVTDKEAEIAMLQTLGLSRARVMAVFMIQGGFSGVLGSLLGFGLGLLLTLNLDAVLNVLGINFYSSAGGSQLPVLLNSAQLVIILFSTLALCVLASLYPAWRASRVQPAEALRYE
ncbi:lipoprotein-releasing ABC transporter permease subunit [Oceanimonas baumannii]|uniref:lipoprotein-releasing ABC transporter permease subunit n=1 Tax=Oceanimonas baumannii TaxID=129578 RepID=UPI001D18F43B|nr:lipoprotein-releasing ABC transporter permease subunit [Oceanimonas baumannii]MCC4263905.1 lipoprotein-releasing ABC transporter permease subunit [Oceanimonas baumannii]